jgi:foldase protein PrsA
VKKIPGLLLVSALVLSACGPGTGALAATVNGSDITVGDVEGLIHLEEGTITKTQFAEFLGFQIQWAVVEEAVREEYGVEVTEDEILAEADRIFEEFSADGETREDFTAARGVTEEFLKKVAHQGLLDTRVTEVELEDADAPTQEAIDQAMDDAVLQATEVCVSHILLGELTGLTGEELETALAAAEEDALDVLDRLEAGEDFAEIATELSTDPGSGANGGDLGCSSPAGYVPEFRDATLTAPIGEVLDSPVETVFGFHVILVSDRTEPTEDQLPTEDELMESLSAQTVSAEIQTWVLQRIQEATVTVVERFGTWEPSPTPRVIAPSE